MNSKIINAIENYQILEFYYDGGIRIVEPHCFGVTTKGNNGLRAFQIEGYSKSGETIGWKMFLLSDIISLVVSDQVFLEPRTGYKKGDRGMSNIYKEL